MDKKTRSRNFCAVSYLSLEDIISSINYCGKIRHYAIICHDKDTDINGNLKEKHYHICANTYNGLSLSAFRKLFVKNANTLAQFLIDKSGAFDYLTHSDNPEKYQYSIDDIQSDDLSYWQDNAESDNISNLLNDIINKVPLRDLVSRYGRDFVLHYQTYMDFAHLLQKNNEYVDGIKDCEQMNKEDNNNA